jgi:hypothetical protein
MLRNATLVKNLTIRFDGQVHVIKDEKAMTPLISGVTFLTPHEYQVKSPYFIKKLGATRMVYGKAMHRIIVRNSLKGMNQKEIYFDHNNILYKIHMIHDEGTLLFMYDNELFKSIRSVIYFITGQYPASIGDTFHACHDLMGRDLSYYLTMISLYHYKKKKVA